MFSAPSKAAGEFILDLHFERIDDGWTVVRSDEMTLAEYHGRAP